MNTIADIANAILKHDNFIVTAHHNPDGDALGSMCAVGFILRYYKKNFVLYNSTPIPEYLHPSPKPSPIYSRLWDIPKDFHAESIIILDVSHPKRIGEELYALLPSLYSINIDHHRSCPEFANVNMIDPSYSATGCIVASIAQHLTIPLKDELGECLYLAITEDTGNFRNANTDKLSLSLASTIVGNGLIVDDFIHTYHNTWSLQQMQLWGYLLSSFSSHSNGAVLILKISEKLLQQYSCSPEDIDGINSFLLRIKGVRVVFLLKEVNNQTYTGVKLSIRSYKIDIIPLVQSLGGGGHLYASGAFIENISLEEAEQKVMHLLPTYINIFL